MPPPDRPPEGPTLWEIAPAPGPDESARVGQREYTAPRARRGGPATSHEAAKRARRTAPQLIARIADHIARTGRRGATLDEVVVALGVPLQSASGRVLDLRRRGVIEVKTSAMGKAMTRPTRTGAPARVYVMAAPGSEER